MSRLPRHPAPVLLTLLYALSAPLPGAAQTIDIFTTVDPPGTPEGIAVAPGGTVYVGTNRAVPETGSFPSVIFAYDSAGQLVDQWTVQGQNQSNSGLLGIAVDGDGYVYALDRDPARVLILDPATGLQGTYATFSDVPNCATPWSIGDVCGADSDASAPTPNYPVFAPDGTLYVTDSSQGLIWRVPAGGHLAGPSEVWFSHADLDGVFGPNGIQFRFDQTTLLFAMTGYQGVGPGFATGRLYELPVLGNGDPGSLTTFWTSLPADGPDGFSIADFGNVYVALAGTNQVVVIDDLGAEIARVPGSPAENALLPVPMDMPASTGFLGDRLLVTNQSLFTGNSNSWVVYDIFVDEPGLPLHHPLPEPTGSAGFAAGVAVLAILASRRRRARAEA